MEKPLPYHVTETGVRIPKSKIKWMVPPEGSKPKRKFKSKNRDSDVMFSISKNYNDLVASNFNAFMQYSNTIEADGPLDESQEESNPEESDPIGR